MGKNVNVISWLENFVNKVLAFTDNLNGLDTAIGDGDHGDNMRKGVLELNSYIQTQLESLEKDSKNPQELFNAMSSIFLRNIEGASGPLYAAAFKNMAESWDNEESSLNDVILSGCEGIKRIGHCEVGDKTMFDVWHGVYGLLENNTLTTDNVQEQVLDTKDMLAKKRKSLLFW